MCTRGRRWPSSLSPLRASIPRFEKHHSRSSAQIRALPPTLTLHLTLTPTFHYSCCMRARYTVCCKTDMVLLCHTLHPFSHPSTLPHLRGDSRTTIHALTRTNTPAPRSGIPGVKWFGSEGDYNVLVIDLLGPSLEDLFNYCGKRLSLKTVLMLADQVCFPCVPCYPYAWCVCVYSPTLAQARGTSRVPSNTLNTHSTLTHTTDDCSSGVHALPILHPSRRQA